MQPFFSLLEAIESLAGEESDSYVAEFALHSVQNYSEKCLPKLFLEVVLWCCDILEETDIYHRLRKYLVQHIKLLLRNHHTTQCVLYEDVPEVRHQPSPTGPECLCSRLHRFYEVY